MRMANTFTLPISPADLHYDVIHRLPLASPSPSQAAAHAVSHHDALVEALTGLADIQPQTDPLGDATLIANELLSRIADDN